MRKMKWARFQGGILSVTMVCVSAACSVRDNQPVIVESLSVLHENKSDYDGLLVSVPACIYATSHGFGFVSCSGDRETMTSIMVAKTEEAERAFHVIKVAIAEARGRPGPMLPLTLVGKFKAVGPENMSAIDMQSADFAQEVPVSDGDR
jgi:hypothetical protein